MNVRQPHPSSRAALLTPAGEGCGNRGPFSFHPAMAPAAHQTGAADLNAAPSTT